MFLILRLVLCELLFSTVSVWASTEALIVNFGGDHSEIIEDVTQRLTAGLASRGVPVRIVKPESDMRSALTAAIQQLPARDTIYIYLFGHGNVFDLPHLSPERFPPIKYSRPYLSGREFSQDTTAFVFGGPDAFDVHSEQSINFALGTGDLLKLLQGYLSRNPNSQIQLFLSQCYSGAAARSLARIPRLYVFTAGSEVSKAILGFGPQGPKYGWTGFLQNYADEHLNSLLGPSDFDKFNEAREQLRPVLDVSSTEEVFDVPQGPVESVALAWCSDHRRSEDLVAKGSSKYGTQEPDRRLHLWRYFDQYLKIGEQLDEYYFKKNNCVKSNFADGLTEADYIFGELSDIVADRIESIQRSDLLNSRVIRNEPERLSVLGYLAKAGVIKIRPESGFDLEDIRRQLRSWLSKMGKCPQTDLKERCLEIGLLKSLDTIALLYPLEEATSPLTSDCDQTANVGLCLRDSVREFAKHPSESYWRIRQALRNVRNFRRFCLGQGELAYARGCFTEFINHAEPSDIDAANAAAQWLQLGFQPGG